MMSLIVAVTMYSGSGAAAARAGSALVDRQAVPRAADAANNNVATQTNVFFLDDFECRSWPSAPR